MRSRTINNYAGIKTDVERFLRDNSADDPTLDQFVQQSTWSRRQVQRALAYFNTGWRELTARYKEA